MNINSDYPETLERDNKIKLLVPFTRAKDPHLMECLVCGHKWTATPLSKKQTFKTHGVGGCPNCNRIRIQEKSNDITKIRLLELETRGIILLEPLTSGLRGHPPVLWRNINCGHEFRSLPGNVVSRGIICPVCAMEARIAQLQLNSKVKVDEWLLTATEWQIYKSDVTRYTNLNYRLYKSIINPDNLYIGKAGIEGAHHVDHIVPKRLCF